MSALWEGAGVDAGSGGLDSRLTVYISSNLGELNSEREAARSAIKTLRLRPAGVDLGSRQGQSHPTLEDADIFVGIYWQSLGWAGGDGSDLERDYDLGAGLPGLAYVKEPGTGRGIFVCITPAGRERYEEARPAHRSALEEALA